VPSVLCSLPRLVKPLFYSLAFSKRSHDTDTKQLIFK
jgi:hypothetical protein